MESTMADHEHTFNNSQFYCDVCGEDINNVQDADSEELEMQTLVQREGSSIRNMDSLDFLFIEDAFDVLINIDRVSLNDRLATMGWTNPDFSNWSLFRNNWTEIRERAFAYLDTASGNYDFSESEDMQNLIEKFKDDCESLLDALDYVVEWQDGFTINK